jgi:hypothetical protein
MLEYIILKRWHNAPWQPACQERFTNRDECSARLAEFRAAMPERQFAVQTIDKPETQHK